MDLENTMFSEVSQTEKDKYYMISLMWNLKKVKLVSITQKDSLGEFPGGPVG